MKPVAVTTTSATLPLAVPAHVATSNASSPQQPQLQSVQPQLPQPLPQPVANNVMQDKLVPIQLTFPAPPGSQDTQSRVYHLNVPASALASA